MEKDHQINIRLSKKKETTRKRCRTGTPQYQQFAVVVLARVASKDR